MFLITLDSLWILQNYLLTRRSERFPECLNFIKNITSTFRCHKHKHRKRNLSRNTKKTHHRLPFHSFPSQQLRHMIAFYARLHSFVKASIKKKNHCFLTALSNRQFEHNLVLLVTESKGLRDTTFSYICTAQHCPLLVRSFNS